MRLRKIFSLSSDSSLPECGRGVGVDGNRGVAQHGFGAGRGDLYVGRVRPALGSITG